ncbi:response regulator transcription factor [Rhizobium sp. BK251]|uniref:response regulator n=1 Tax=Rhizobium sp. BK251 TaxID=2512125 RepID=UPI00104F1BBC|nr:response regulator transcription factor [Rhizobium sp. BK251]TCL68204.1 LuxR family two component transcriptional regulator [Rhizobium sp. BK251]
MPISVAFVDDHPILLEGLVSLYSGKDDLFITAQGENAVDALKIAEEKRPDVLVLDLNMPGDTMATIEMIVRNHNATKIIVFTAASNIETAVKVLDLGVNGYVLKGSTARDLHEAIKIVHGGNTFITPGFATKVILSMKAAELRRKTRIQKRLSAREEQIVRYLMMGKTNREIACMLDISEKTVKHYMTLLMQKLDARNRLEVVLAAQKLDVPMETAGADTGARFN